MSKTRNPNLDVIRCLAVLLVIVIHFFLNTKFYDVTINSWQLEIMVGMRTICMICVPLFMCLTGYLMHEKELSWEFYHKLWPTLSVYLQSSALIYLARIGIFRERLSLADGVLGIFSYSTAPYAWYVEMYIGLYLLIPFLNMIWQGCQTRGQHQLLVATFVILCILPTFLNIFGKMIPDYWVTLYPLAYYFSGAYIHTYETEVTQIPLRLVTLMIVLLSVMHNLNASAGRIFQWLPMNDFGSSEIYALTIVIFVGILKARLPKTIGDIAKYIAPYTFAMYLVSYIGDQLIYPIFMNWFKTESAMLAWMAVPILLIFIGSLLLAIAQKLFWQLLRVCLDKFWQKYQVL
ncbi:hypothetical protein EQG49_00695 [Periweissella cryptocerci]|uniref:Acyltransferase 3 domain-containing protein n=1 Tax=Periweissella cryptocerci TaxID=2506420 RepID=A0A4P6YR54_9LACO|nr:acyltransferase family protein [Periweissella cryptocerci]QBO35072.1 hypothetical protein EQG49_00695 [Periweissella cryptocerci]